MRARSQSGISSSSRGFSDGFSTRLTTLHGYTTHNIRCVARKFGRTGFAKRQKVETCGENNDGNNYDRNATRAQCSREFHEPTVFFLWRPSRHANRLGIRLCIQRVYGVRSRNVNLSCARGRFSQNFHRSNLKM